MPRSLARWSASESSHRDLSSAVFITNIAESDFGTHRELLGHYIGPARHIATDCGPDVHGLTNPEFMRGHRTSCLGRLFPMCAHASDMQPAPRVSARSSKPQTAKRATRIENKARGKG